MQNHIGSQRNR